MKIFLVNFYKNRGNWLVRKDGHIESHVRLSVLDYEAAIKVAQVRSFLFDHVPERVLPASYRVLRSIMMSIVLFEQSGPI